MTHKVLVIESRTSSDKNDKLGEQQHLSSTFDLLKIKAKIIEVSTAKEFYNAIKIAQSSHITHVHFSGHGSKDKIYLGDNDSITWKEMDENCWPLLKGTCLSFSSSDVAKGVEEIFSYHTTFCSAIVAATRVVTWSESAIAFSAFFLRATTTETSTDQDVTLMNHICGKGTYKLFQHSKTPVLA